MSSPTFPCPLCRGDMKRTSDDVALAGVQSTWSSPYRFEERKSIPLVVFLCDTCGHVELFKYGRMNLDAINR